MLLNEFFSDQNLCIIFITVHNNLQTVLLFFHPSQLWEGIPLVFSLMEQQSSELWPLRALTELAVESRVELIQFVHLAKTFHTVGLRYLHKVRWGVFHKHICCVQNHCKFLGIALIPTPKRFYQNLFVIHTYFEVNSHSLVDFHLESLGDLDNLPTSLYTNTFVLSLAVKSGFWSYLLIKTSTQFYQ